MKYVCVNVRLGLAAAETLPQGHKTFQRKVINILLPTKKQISCKGLEMSVPFDYNRIAYEPHYIFNIIKRALRDSSAEGMELLDLLMIDFSQNPFDLLRDPILINLAEILEYYCTMYSNKKYLILLPELPAKGTASCERFKVIQAKENHNVILFLGNSGNKLCIPSGSWQIKNLRSQYKQLVSQYDEQPLVKLKQKLVKKVGHFRKSTKHGRTRIYSYVIDNCDEELLDLLKDWWDSKRLNNDAIIYDTGSIPSLTDAVISFAELRGLSHYRILDIISSQSTLISKAKKHESCLMVLDVVETGETLKSHRKKLQERGIRISDRVLCAINKGAGNETRIEDLFVSSFLAVEPDPEGPAILQREIGLPTMSELDETYDTIRSFDLWWMASCVGWGPETEVPKNIGYGYEIVPIFPKMLLRFGDWIAFKMEQLLTKINCPANMFVIHPDEPGATSVSDKLRLRFEGRLAVVRIPRDHIKLAQSLNDSWDEALERIKEKKEWFQELKTVDGASALITDVFNASGSTFRSIYELLKNRGISTFCYFPFIDRDCSPNNQDKYPIPKYSLYEWYGPRKLKERKRDDT